MPAARIFLQLIADFRRLSRSAHPSEKGDRRRESLSTSAARTVPRTQSGPAANRSRDAHYVGSTLKVLQLARCAHCGSTEDVDSLASSRVSTSVALEIKTGTPSDSC